MDRMQQTRPVSGQQIDRGKRWRWLSLLMMIYDFAAVCFAWFGVLWARFDFQMSEIPTTYFQA